MLKYEPERLWPIYEKLPGDLKETIFSEKTAGTIFDMCRRNGIDEMQMSEIARYIGYVLLGLVRRNEFQSTVEKEVELPKTVAKQIALETNSLIFFPVKSSLDFIFQEEALPAETVPSVKPMEATKPKLKTQKDTYREPIE